MTLREETQVTAYKPHAPDQGALASRLEARPRHAYDRFKLALSKSEAILPLNRWESPAARKRNLPEKQCFWEKEPLTEDNEPPCNVGSPAARASSSHTSQARVKPHWRNHPETGTSAPPAYSSHWTLR